MMSAQPLLDLLLPAYAPCQHFAGACANACIWEPDCGLVPCAFGGATGSVDDVKLVVVTAEPGDPPDDANYRGSAADMLHNSLRVFTEAMQRGGLDRPGRPTPFHRNMRQILDCFFPGQSLAEQLRQTWTTNAVLCPAQVSGGPHFTRVEATCAGTYLAPQLALLSHAFVFALGNKARDRLVAAGLRFDAVGRHPSARVSDADKRGSWLSAAERFYSGDRTASADAPAPRQPPPVLRQATAEERVAAASSPRELGAALRDAINELPEPVASFFRSVNAHPDYACQAGRMQLMVYFRGQKVGGLNRQASHWYFSKVFVREHGSPALMEVHGFQHVIHNEKHDFWLAPRNGALDAFEAAITEMTGIPL